MDNLTIKTYNTRKNSSPKYKENLGCVTVHLPKKNCVIFDNFDGSGEDYKEREETLISIFESGLEIWEGTESEFFQQLKK